MENQASKLKLWQDRLESATNEYQATLDTITDNEKAYYGTRKIKKSDGITDAEEQASNVRKMCFELVESQIDSVIPMPKVTSPKGLETRAQSIEILCRNEIDRLNIEEINDEQGRTTPIAGASIFYVEWDNSRTTRTTIGELKVRNLDPRQLIPQEGVKKIDDMDYLFIQLQQTKEYILKTYGVDVELEANKGVESNEDSPYDHMATHTLAFYWNDDGEIGLYSFVGDTVIQDYNSYYARQKKVCTKCGTTIQPDVESCPNCGNTKFKDAKLEFDEVEITDEETGKVQTIKVPYYIPKCFPVVLRKNVSDANTFLGGSDMTMVKDQQNDVNIYMTKIRQRMLKGGSLITLPEDVEFKLNDDELKVIRVKDLKQISMISVKDLKPGIRDELSALDMNYQMGKDTLGINDSFQGKKDTTATSAVAKEFASSRAAGRLESKKKMKDFAYSGLYELMFKFNLAFADEPRPYAYQGVDGKAKYGYFDKLAFLEKDKSGEWYYDDEFLFATDISGTLANDRQAMWKETRSNFEGGAYGDPLDIQTLIMYWKTMDSLHYPGAKTALDHLNARLQEQQKQMEKQAQMEAVANSGVEKIAKENAELKNQGQQGTNIVKETLASIGGK